MKNYLLFILLISVSIKAQVFNQVDKKVSIHRAVGSEYGTAVKVLGNITVVGSPRESVDENGNNFLDGAGAAFIYERQGNADWSTVQKIVATTRGGSDYFGNSVTIDGDQQVFIGAMSDNLDSLDNNNLSQSGAVFVFAKSGGTWSSIQKIVPFDRVGGERFGASIDVKDSLMIVGARGFSGANQVGRGSAYVYRKDITGRWNFIQKLVNPIANEGLYFGWNVAVSDNWLAVSDAKRLRHQSLPPSSTNDTVGVVYLYENTGSNWVFRDTVFSQKAVNTPATARGLFGTWVEIEGSKLVIGDPQAVFPGGILGLVTVYNLQAGVGQVFAQEITRPGAGPFNPLGWFGWGLDISGNKLLIGAPGQLGTGGASFLYDYDGSNYVNPIPIQRVNTTGGSSTVIPGSGGATFISSFFGGACSIDGGKIVIGAVLHTMDENGNGPSLDHAGAAYIFEQCVHSNIPQITSVTNNLTLCSGDSVQLVIDPSNSLNSAREWFWYTGTYGSGTLVDSTDTVWVKPTVSTTYSVAGEGYCVGAGLSDSVGTVTITVIANPIVSVVASPNDTICAGESVILNGSGASSYVWDNGVVNGGSFIPTSTQTYKVVGTSSGCKDSTTIQIVLNSNPNVSIVPLASNTICSGTSITLSGAGTVSYSWDNGVVDGASFVPTATTTYTVTGTGGVGCTDTESITVTVVAGPTVTATSSITTVCEGSQVSLSSTGADTYVWNNGGGPGASVIVTPTVTTDYTVTGTQNATNCTDTETITITVNPLPNVVAIATPNDTLCFGENLTLSGSGASTYSWNNGVLDGIIFTPSLGQVQYILTGTDLNNCINRDTVNVRVTQPPTVGGIGPLGALCSGEPATLTGTGAVSYVWDNGVQDGVAFTPTSTQIYNVIGTDANNCTGTASVQIVVNQSPNVAAFSSAGGSSLCEGDTLTLTATGNGQNYSWDNNVQDASPFIPSAGSNVYIVTATSSNSCTAQASVTVVVNEQEDATITPLPSLCGDVPIQTLEAVTPNGVWQGLGIINSATGEFDASVAGEGTHEIVYTTTGICNDTDTINVEIFQELIVNSYGDSVCFGDIDGNIRVEVVQGVAPYNYLWETEETTPNLTNLGEGVYQVIVKDANNCIKNIDVVIFTTEICNYHVFLPNIFSPNGDGINDKLFVRGKGFESLEFYIYDRWGNKMFQTTDKEKGWDGTNAGKKVAAGVYVYYVSVKYFDGSVITKEGNVSVSY